MVRHRILWSLCVAAFLMAGCDSVPVRRVPPERAGEPGQQTGAQTSEIDAPARSAAARLREEGVRQLEAGDTERASSWLERAIRIDPASAESYYQLARVRVLDGLHAEARELLLRARSLLDSQGIVAVELTQAIERLLGYIAGQSVR